MAKGFKIAVLVSGGGTNLQSIIDNIEEGNLKCTIDMVISDREGAYAIKRAKENNIKAYVLDRKEYGKELSYKILNLLEGKVELIVLAGWLSILEGDILKSFKDRIINIHPSLLPSFGGCGMFGIKVHEEVIRYGVKFSGCTVHIVDSGTDTGAIICQKIVSVYEEDNAKTLQERVLKEEHKALSEAIELFIDNKISIKGREVRINK
ncbi:phosphoribosylglycinamide formyltransferase [Clostridium tetani]|uniref:Phosphoribosylglycinamide formyltransferase n=1 Tax=Clostridium tetani TaxID=1513 RepID=A0ABY0ESV4_CLOTA|nr:phosphoribosylglycinamide formyltransferase [Clostridium tetani]CDI50145.1 phosphoribosylglycinamide formyltransferase [Clostridium tetani 12124569]KHO38306.1 phosphoribosylglycinamide formyltransferase [Clostridium tetani]RXI40302.1 phosphoribosylglycinamide formyltransferase [Clostridium tetani]RXI56594.1 phosphoribosylglycinamide formyltransferase [Clostridium tetani]RXI70468.1 phosphoribosylglycinamide formyltransferase [Clostridium tetani]